MTAALAIRPVDPAADRPLTLAVLLPGARARVLGVDAEPELAAALQSAGLWAGVEVECLGQAPFGDPLRFRLHGYRLALRRSEAATVRIERLPESGS